MTNRSRVSWLCAALLVLFLVGPEARAQSPEEAAAASAVVWLNGAQNADGSWGASPDIRTLQTSAVVVALRSFAERNAAYYRGITWLENHAPSNLDYLARRVLALVAHGDDVQADTAVLQQAQNLASPGNGAWGLGALYDGAVLDTALALRAYAETGLTVDVQPALDFLKAKQLASPDFGWSMVEGSPSSAVVSAETLLTLVDYVSVDPTLSSVVSSGAGALALSVGVSDPALWRAHAALALERSIPGDPAIGSLMNSLVLDQALNGSWDDDVQTTAATLRALAGVLGTDSSAFAASVFVPDLALRAAINQSIGRNALDEISLGEILNLTVLNALAQGIADLSGLEVADNLTFVDLRNNQITDIAPLVGLPLTGVLLHGNPLSMIDDTDGDGLFDGEESQTYFTNPLDPDSDGDGFADGAEVAAGTDPNDPGDFPGAQPIPVLPLAWRLALVVLLLVAGTWALQRTDRRRWNC